MEAPRTRVPLAMPLSGVMLLILGVVAGPIIQNWATPEQLARNVLLSAIPFILIFAAIVIEFMSLNWWLASVLNHRIAYELYRPIEIALIGGIVLGGFGMFQPWVFGFFKIGFLILLFSTLGFILWSHIRPAGAKVTEERGGVSVAEIDGGERGIR